MDTKIYDEFWNKESDNYKDLVQVISAFQEALKQEKLEPNSEIEPEIQITISVNKDCTTWSYQSGDNSYTGSCYGDPYWGVNWIGTECNPYDVADYLIQNLSEQIEFTK